VAPVTVGHDLGVINATIRLGARKVLPIGTAFIFIDFDCSPTIYVVCGHKRVCECDHDCFCEGSLYYRIMSKTDYVRALSWSTWGEMINALRQVQVLTVPTKASPFDEWEDL
jgi:hypothetical protein